MLRLLNEHIVKVTPCCRRPSGRSPKAKVEVKRVRCSSKDGASNGYYNSAAPDGSRPAPSTST
jgi:uncharacterized protein (DUF885 family)